ncbi:MAG: hypothetical protein PWK00_07605, partial [Coxiella burnetii]|nr:hypothetical protein [Coxiella burnetii]
LSELLVPDPNAPNAPLSFEVEAINSTPIPSPAAPPSSWKTLALGSYTSLSFQLQQTYQEAKFL